jgi:quercetin dioxygenase-like cupin family protein
MAPRSPSIDDPLTGQHLTFTHTANDTRGTSVRAVVRLEPAGFVPRHLHLRQDEHLEVLTGSIRLRAGGTSRLLSAGDTATIPRRHVHRVANAGASEASFVLEVHPARRIERTIRTMFAMGRALRPLAKMRVLNQAWWAPFAAMLVVAQLLVAQAFLIGDGTSNILNAESTAAGATLALGSAAALVAGLWARPRARGPGNALIVAGAALAAIWVWTVVMTPAALVVIVGVALSQLRATHPTNP